MTLPSHLHKQLEVRSGKKIRLKINDNRSTMLSVRWDPDYTKVSLHKMFLNAPDNIMDALACYIQKQHKVLPLHIKIFIEENLKKLDYSHQVENHKLEHKGKIYNLQTIYDEINRDYFNGKLDLNITWYGYHKQLNRSRIIFGLYSSTLKLIKINRLLDHPNVPEYVVWYVVYHEMLHHICPAYRDTKGIYRIHSKEFKELEIKFRYYYLAQRWIKENREDLFRGCI